MLIAHLDPDGDALGAILSFAEFLKSLGKTVKLATADNAPQLFGFLEGIEHIKNDFLIGDFDAIVLIDNGDLKRTGFAERILAAKKKGKIIINIDHHPQNDLWKIATVNIANTTYSSTCEIMYDIFTHFQFRISHEVATSLLAGIYYDTGGFQHSNTSAKVLKIAGLLLNQGAKLKKISDSVSKSRTPAMLKLWGIALDRMKISSDNKLVYSIITNDDIAAVGASEEDISGLVNLLNSTDEAKASMLLYETNDGRIKGSFRTESEEVDLSRLASLFGGGGHKKASGFSVKGKLVRDGEKWRVE